MELHQTLKSYFGYDTFRPGQESIISFILDGKDTLAILPTGGGKSLCFQIPALSLEGTTIVISPLISLMQDQVQALQQRGINAAMINSSQEKSEYGQTLKDFGLGALTMLYVSPERLKNQEFIKACRRVLIPLIVVDEAHCISEWGNDFRPPYKEITTFIKKLEVKPVVAAFTATATPEVKQDIITSLQLKTPYIHQDTFKRKNLHLTVTKCLSRTEQELYLLRLINRFPSSTGIVYTATRAGAEYLAALINYYSCTQTAAAYHGGMEKADRSRIQEAFISGEQRVIIATNAFGMGIDKSDVRFVIHYHPSTSIENYYQEVGRAGRDGKPSFCFLLYNPHNLVIHRGLIAKQKHQKRSSAKLQAMINYANSDTCRSQSILKYFGESNSTTCQNCDSCDKHTNEMITYKHPLLELMTESEKNRVQKLLTIREAAAKTYRCSNTEVMTDSVLCSIALHQPATKEDYLKIPGIGFGWVERWHDTITAYDNRRTS